MKIQLSTEQHELFKNITGTEPLTADNTAQTKTQEYLIEMAEMCVATDKEIEDLKNAGFESIAERMSELENALIIHDVAKLA